MSWYNKHNKHRSNLWGGNAVKNKGIKIGVVFLLLFALLSVAGCQYDDVVIVGAASGQPGPTSAAAHWVYTARTQRSQYSTVTEYNHQRSVAYGWYVLHRYKYRYRRYNRTDRCGDRHRSDIHICKFWRGWWHISSFYTGKHFDSLHVRTGKL